MHRKGLIYMTKDTSMFLMQNTGKQLSKNVLFSLERWHHCWTCETCMNKYLKVENFSRKFSQQINGQRVFWAFISSCQQRVMWGCLNSTSKGNENLFWTKKDKVFEDFQPKPSLKWTLTERGLFSVFWAWQDIFFAPDHRCGKPVSFEMFPSFLQNAYDQRRQ